MNVRAEGAGPPAHEVVYRRLREMVLFGELEPGQAVRVDFDPEKLHLFDPESGSRL